MRIEAYNTLQNYQNDIFMNNKDKILFLSQAAVVYKFECPGCNSHYIGKMEQISNERTEEHAYNNN